MLRASIFALCATVLCAASLLAEDVKGTVAGVDADKNTITLTVDGKDQTYTVSKDASIVTDDAKAKALSGGLASVKKGASVTLSTEKQEEVEVVTVVKVTKETKPPKERKKRERKKKDKNPI